MFIQSCSHSFTHTEYSRHFSHTLSIYQRDNHVEPQTWVQDLGQVLSLSLIFLTCLPDQDIVRLETEVRSPEIYFVTYVTVTYLSFESMMKEIRRQFPSPQTPLSQSKRAAKSSQRFPHNATSEMSQDISHGLIMPSASFLQAFPAAHGELRSSRGEQSLSFTSSPSGGAPGLRTGVSAEFAARWDPWSWFVPAVRSAYLPPSKSQWPCLPLGCGSWKLWPDCFFVLQPHTWPYFSQSRDSRAEPVTWRRPPWEVA